jgi:hypothetical protein
LKRKSSHAAIWFSLNATLNGKDSASHIAEIRNWSRTSCDESAFYPKGMG